MGSRNSVGGEGGEKQSSLSRSSVKQLSLAEGNMGYISLGEWVGAFEVGVDH